jgi:CheY-like chemotaxis protein
VPVVPASSLTAPAVLVVEDDRDVREAIEELLADDGYRPLTAANGREALDLLERLSSSGVPDSMPCLMLVDLFMPVMGGVELVARLEHHPVWGTIPLVVMTAANDRMQGTKVDRPVLNKPVDFELLGRILAQYCSQDRSQDRSKDGEDAALGDAPAAPVDSGA